MPVTAPRLLCSWMKTMGGVCGGPNSGRSECVPLWWEWCLDQTWGRFPPRVPNWRRTEVYSTKVSKTTKTPCVQRSRCYFVKCSICLNPRILWLSILGKTWIYRYRLPDCATACSLMKLSIELKSKLRDSWVSGWCSKMLWWCAKHFFIHQFRNSILRLHFEISEISQNVSGKLDFSKNILVPNNYFRASSRPSAAR